MSNNINDNELIKIISLAMKFIECNYDYVWLKSMIQRDNFFYKKNPTLITGSSHSLFGIKPDLWENSINCSMNSQDIFYDFQCAKEVIKEKGRFSKCIIVFGYYIAFQDLSLSKLTRSLRIERTYYPIFHNAHNWDEPNEIDLWKGFCGISEKEKMLAEFIALRKTAERNSYWSDEVERWSLYDFGGRKWYELSEEEKEMFGKHRAEDHNGKSVHEASLLENKEILKDYIHFLNMNETKPIIIIPPFTKYYNKYINQRSKEGVEELIKSITDKFEFVDYNDYNCFDDSDFVDTDHLNIKGAEKLSNFLIDLYGV